MKVRRDETILTGINNSQSTKYCDLHDDHLENGLYDTVGSINEKKSKFKIEDNSRRRVMTERTKKLFTFYEKDEMRNCGRLSIVRPTQCVAVV